MISKKKTRDALQNYLYKNRQIKYGSKDWVITGFRHAIFKTVDLCKGIEACRYEMNLEEKTTTCYLFFKTSTAKCIYKVFEDRISVEQIETVVQDGNEMDVTVKYYDCTCEELPKTVLQIQPKVKLVIKRKK